MGFSNGKEKDQRGALEGKKGLVKVAMEAKDRNRHIGLRNEIPSSPSQVRHKAVSPLGPSYDMEPRRLRVRCSHQAFGQTHCMDTMDTSLHQMYCQRRGE